MDLFRVYMHLLTDCLSFFLGLPIFPSRIPCIYSLPLDYLLPAPSPFPLSLSDLEAATVFIHRFVVAAAAADDPMEVSKTIFTVLFFAAMAGTVKGSKSRR